MHRTPAVAYRSAGGTRESISHDVSGLLVDEPQQFLDALRALVSDAGLRERLGEGSLEMSHRFTWEHAQESFAHVVAASLRGERVDTQDPDAE
jgi:glycosyltransferase involved in cell wall biosynthesis